MKMLTRRAFALLLALVLCLGTVPCVTFAADAAAVDYVTGSVSGFSNVIKNWGTRGTTATFLSPNAEAFYEDNNTSYDLLSAYSGASSTSDVPDSALYNALQTLMASNHSVITSYDDTRPLYAFTDCENSGNPTTISSFYSGKSIGPAWDSGATWNREHVWPNSKGLGGSDENDIMMLRPTASSENFSRGNDAYGESSGYYDPNSVSGGTYNLHGDVARIFLYTYVRWGNTGELAWGSSGVMESKEVLLKWMEEDPVDTWELGRNDSVESITGTRNVFVDYPELAFLLFNEEIPADMTTPSGEAADPGYAITATANNSSWGSVSVNGKVINATPATGYALAGYTLLSGEAEVVQDGDAFIVSPSSDCAIQINFIARIPAAVSFSENGGEPVQQTAYVGDVLTLPEPSAQVPEQYTFLGWTTGSLTETTAKPAVIYPAGTLHEVTGAVSFYALYFRMDEAGTDVGNVFTLYSGDLTEGDYLVVYEGGAMKAEMLDGRIGYADVTAFGDSIITPEAELVWHIAPTADGSFTIYNEKNAVYAAGSGASNKATLLSDVTDFAKWNVTGTEVYTFANVGNQAAGKSYTLVRNDNYGFACYAATYKGPLSLYRAASGTVYYTTVASECLHGSTQAVVAKAATCTESGYTAGVYCNSCGSYISGHEFVAALGHSYSTDVTPPTVTDQGYTTYTCTRCGDSYVGDYTPALGETYTVSFAVPSGVSAVEDMACDGSGITLPTPGVPTGEYTYTFAGWAAGAVGDSETAPILYAAGSSYTAEADTTLYAVYTYSQGSSGSGTWKLVTDDSALTAGMQLVIASNTGYTAGGISSKYLASIETTFSEDLTTIPALPDDTLVLTLDGSEGAWTLANADGDLLGATTVKKLAWGSRPQPGPSPLTRIIMPPFRTALKATVVSCTM